MSESFSLIPSAVLDGGGKTGRGCIPPGKKGLIDLF